MLTGTNVLAYSDFCLSSNDEEKKFYNIDSKDEIDLGQVGRNWFDLIMINSLPVSADGWQAWVPGMLSNFYFVKNHKTVDNSANTEARENLSPKLESL